MSSSWLPPFRHNMKAPVLIQIWSAALDCSDLSQDILRILGNWKAASKGMENGSMFII